MQQEAFQFSGEANKMVTRLHTAFNNNRTAKKMKKLYRNKLGDAVASELLSYGGTQRLLINGQTLTQGIFMQFGLPAENAEFGMFEMKIQIQASELENYFLQAFEEMMKSVQHRGILFQNSHTHACFAFRQSGIYNDVFQIGVLLFTAEATIDKVVEQGMNNNSTNSGCIIVGKMINVNKKPFAAVFNRGKQDCPMVVVGPNRIYFDYMNGDEFKIFIPNGYSNLPAHLHPLMVGQPTIEIYCADSKDKTFQLANEIQIQTSFQNDFNSNQDPSQYQGISIAFATFFAQQIDYRELPPSYNLQQALESHDLLKLVNGQPSCAIQHRGPPQGLINRLNAGGARANTSMVSTNQNQVQIKKTNTQLMREQKALEQRNKVSDFNVRNPSPNFGQSLNPRFQLNNTFGGIQSNQQSLTPSKVNKFQMAVSNVSIPQQPRFQFVQNTNQSVQKPFQQPNFNPFAQKQDSNFVRSSSIPKFSFNPQPQPISHQQPVFQQPIWNQPVWQQPQPQFKFQTQFQPVQQTFQFQPQPTQQNQMITSQYEPQQQYAVNTPVPVRFAVNGKLASAFDSKRDPNYNQKISFAGLSSVDQEILKTCLQELSRTLTSHELKRAEMLMLEQPFQFYEFYTQSVHQPQQVEEGQKKQAEQQPEEKQKMAQVRDFDDISLFILQFAQKKISSSKYIRTKGDDNGLPIHWNTSKLLDELAKGNLTPIQAINSVILSSETPRNDNFHKLFTQKDTPTDMVFISVKQEKFRCHQIVFQASEFMRSCMKQNNDLNRDHYGENMRIQTFYLPDWIDEFAIKQFIRFAYTSKIKFESQNTRRGYPEEALNLFRVAVYFCDVKLQEALVANEVIPNMNASSAVLFLKHTSEWGQLSSCQRFPNERINTFLRDYCMFHLTKNLPTILRQDKRRLCELNEDFLWELVRQSFNYIVDAKADIEVNLTFAADTFTDDRNIFHLFNKVHERIQSCCGFDNQMIAKIKDIKSVDQDFQACVPLIAGYDFSALQPIKRKNRDSTAFDISQANINQQVSKGKVEELKPANNVFELQDGQPDTGPIKKPSFTIQLDLEEKGIRDLMTMPDSKGVSILSKAFNSERRSWHLKIDIEARTNNISAWVIERGETLMEEQNSLLNRGIPIEFSSVRCQIEIVDAAIQNRKSVFFFSFSHDQNQVIGHKDIANLDQLANCKVLKIKVAIEEYIFHSALMHHFASNFQRKIKEECQKEEALKIVSPVAIENSGYGFFHFGDPVLFWLLSSDIIKVEDEHQVLSFIFQHTKLKTMRKGLDAAILTANLLSKCLRFKYLDIYNTMSAIRKNESLQLSEVFSDGVNSEMQERLRLGKKSVMIPLIAETLLNEEKQIYSGQPRKYFNQKALKEHGREKLLHQNNGIHQAIIQEVIEWALNSKTEMITANAAQQRHFQTDSTYRNLNQQIYEERARANRLADELKSITKKYGTTTSLSTQVIQPQVQPYVQPYFNQQSQPIMQRPPAIIPLSQNRPMDQKENAKPQVIQQQVISKRDPPGFLQQKGGNLAKSFETLNLEDSFKVQKPQNQLLMRSQEIPPLQNMVNTNPTKREDRKPPASIAGKNDQSCDLSTILERLNRSPATPALKSRAITNKYLGGTKAKSDKENCAIF